MEPKKLKDKWNRQCARRDRNSHWLFMEKVAELGKLWYCPWDKYGKHNNHADNFYVDGLLSNGLREWIAGHKDWWKWGAWNEKRCARSIRLTAVGLEALENWTQYDMEPVDGGLVEPGWQCIPMPLIRRKANA